MTNMVDCRSAMELYRYVEWFLYQDDPHEACIDMNMVPLSTKVDWGRNVILAEIMWLVAQEVIKNDNFRHS